MKKITPRIILLGHWQYSENQNITEYNRELHYNSTRMLVIRLFAKIHTSKNLHESPWEPDEIEWIQANTALKMRYALQRIRNLMYKPSESS